MLGRSVGQAIARGGVSGLSSGNDPQSRHVPASMNVAVFHPGTQHSWQTAMAIQDLGRLAWYATSIFYQPERMPYRLERYVPGPIARRLNAEFRRFSHPGLDPDQVRTSGLTEWLERMATRAKMRGLARYLDRKGNERFARSLASEIAKPEQFALWGYNASSLQAFAVGRERGRTCILDRTIGDYRAYNALMDDVQDQYGEWFLPTERRMPKERIDSDQREYDLADCILAGSPFAAQTIRQHAGPAVSEKLRVLNYCFDETHFAGLPPPAPVGADRPVRFLFLGLVIPRKGIHLVLEALSRIPASQAELTIVGHLGVPPSVFARYAERVTYLPTVPRSEVPRIMSEHDVFLLPSYFEGAGITLYEALAAGCALIQSRHCALAVTPDTGILLDAIDTDHLHAAMLKAIEDRSQLNAWRAAAQGEARNYTFARYRENIGNLLLELGL